MPHPDPRLPHLARPSAYRIEITPDIDAASFSGTVEIDLDITTTTDRLVCHAADLIISRAALIGDLEREFEVQLDDQREELTLQADGPLEPGPATVRIEFNGTLNDKLRGFYRSSYDTAAGETRHIATTQFQSTDARRAFPCWDEPAYKATFETTLIVAPDHLAIANTLPVEEVVLDDGRRRIRFAPTMVMSSYLVAFVVGPLEASVAIDVGGIPVRIVHPPGKGHLTAFGLEVAAFALDWLADYYDIAYPGDKLDLVAVPDFAFGAMENLGCVTFREQYLLVDPDDSTQRELQRTTEIISHELAHMWFGNLVTMAWWEGIWLNEAFATFMEVSATAAFRPAWRSWDAFARLRTPAFDIDALATTRPIEFEVHSPDDAEAMYDTLTYEKGAAVVRMLEQHLGPEAFRDGVRHYLRTHAYGNTETHNLWDALEESTGAPVRSLMESWILQGGHPVIETVETDHGLCLHQRHFTLDPSAADARIWTVPIHMSGNGAEQRLLLDTASRVLTGRSTAPTVVNRGGTGFFRSTVSPQSLAELASTDLHTLADDAWSLTIAGVKTADECLTELLRIGAVTDDHITWAAVRAGFAGLASLVDNEAADALAGRIRRTGREALDRIGTTPTSNEPDHLREQRAGLVSMLGRTGNDLEIIETTSGWIDHDDPDLAAAALDVIAYHGDATTREQLRQRWLAAKDPLTELRFLRALTDLPAPELIEPFLDDVRESRIRSQDAPLLLARALTNRRTHHRVWEFISTEWTLLLERFPSNSIVRMLSGLTTLNRPEQPGEIQQFLAEHPVPQAGPQISQILERQRINTALRSREAEPFATALLR